MSIAPASTRRLAVVGGGWAGIAAAVEATRCGHRVTIFEMAPQLGGRARSVSIGGHTLDNGQHILIGAYRKTLALMRTLGADIDQDLMRMPLCLTKPDGSGLHLPSGLPAIAFASAVLKHSHWTFSERLALLAAAANWGLRQFRCDAKLTVAALTSHLPASIRLELIDPLCVAALNTPATSASAQVFLRVLQDALFSGPGSADLLLPRVGLSALLPDLAATWLTSQGAQVLLQQRVEVVRMDDEGKGWWLEGEHFDHVVLAATPNEAARLTREVSPEWSSAASALSFEPIVTVYAISAGTHLPQAMLALPCGDAACAETQPAQFVFDRGQLGGEKGLLAFVISGARTWVDRGLQATINATLAQGQAALGMHLRSPLQVVHAIAEKRATFACTPGLQRPPARIAAGLIAAGDHVDGPYPATLEGAVISGLNAIRLLA